MKKYIGFIKSFFNFLGTQNDYLYPFEGQHQPHGCLYEKPHLWKTRIGFGTAYRLARGIWFGWKK